MCILCRSSNISRPILSVVLGLRVRSRTQTTNNHSLKCARRGEMIMLHGIVKNSRFYLRKDHIYVFNFLQRLFANPLHRHQV
jgi:hypothetical protein